MLFGETWKRSAVVLTRQFQEEAVRNIKLGYTGADPGVRIWTYESALMYSITVFTTIGKREERCSSIHPLSREVFKMRIGGITPTGGPLL